MQTATLSRFRSTGLALAAAGAAVALAFTAFQSAAAQDEGRVRIMHASPDTPAVDIFVDGEPAIEGLAFPDNTGYIGLPAGTYNVQVFPSPSDGTGDPALEADLEVAAGADYTVLATGLLDDGSLGLLPLEDDNTMPAEGDAHVRLIHASPDAPAVDVLVAGTDTEVFSGVAFNEAAGPNPVAAGTYDLDVQVSPDGPVALSLPGITLQDQTVYTAVAVGLVEDESLSVELLVDAEGPTHAPETGTGLASTDGGMNPVWFALAGAALAVAGGTGALALRRR